MGDDILYAQFGRAIARIGDLNKDGFQGTYENLIWTLSDKILSFVHILMDHKASNIPVASRRKMK